MKAFLIILNICLAGGIFWSFLKQAQTPQVNEDEYFFRKTEKDKKKSPAKAEAAAGPRKKTSVPETRDSSVSIRKVVEGNIFDPARCPGARIPGRRNSNAGLDMTLVGTFTIGELSGAIIMQKRRQNNSMPFPWMQGMGGMPMAMPAFRNNGPGGGFGNRPPGFGGGNGGPQNNNNGQGGGFARARFGAGDMYARWRRMRQQQNGGNGNNNGNEPALVFQQYVRVGETLANGYKLTAVTRTSATLMKNSEKIELELVEASRNAGAERSRNTNNNPANGFQRGMMPWMMPGMMMPGMMPGMGGPRGGFQQNGGGFQQNGGGGRNNNSRGSRQGRSRGQ